MAWRWTPYTILPLMAAATLIITAVYILRQRRHRPAVKAGAAVLLACAELMLAYLLEIVSADLPTKILWNKVQYVGLITAPTASLVFSLQYTGHGEWVTRRSLVLLSIMPLITLLLVFTNEAHGLIWRHVRLDAGGPLPELDKTFGIGFWGMLAYLYVLMLVGVFLHTQILIRSRHLYRWQASLLMLVTILAYLGATLDVFKVSPLPRFVSTSLGIAVGGLTVAFTIFRVRRGDVLSVSHKAVIRSMGDAIVVLDAQDYIVDLNPAARHLIGHTASKAIGQPVEQAWPEWLGQIDLPHDEAEVSSREVILGQESEQRVYDVRISSLADWCGRLVSRVVVLRDITERVRAEEALRWERDLAEALEEAAAIVSGTLDPDQVLDRILEQVSRVVPNDATNIMLIEGEQVRIVRWRGYDRLGAEELISSLVFRIPEVASLQHMLESGDPMVIPDTATYPGWVHVPVQDWLRSYAAAPIIVRGEVIGFLNVDSVTPGFFTPTQAEALRAFADHAAAAIENARLYRQAQQEIAERKQAEERIKASLKEKEVLLREIHHRVKNNLQVISSLLYLHSKHIKDEETLEMFQDSQKRVRSMALVHERLYQSQDLARIDFAEYIQSLVNYLFRSYGVNRDVIQLEIKVDDVFLGVDTAIPCGLIINELVSNSLKHAFPNDGAGAVCIDLRTDDGRFTLMVSDNGIGLSEDLDFRDTDSLGLQLVNTFVAQLEGTIELDRSSGTAFRITFTEPRCTERG